MDIKIVVIETPSLGDRSYLIHDGKDALVVDPQRDIDRIADLASREGVVITAVAETHMHNDYVSGGLQLAREHGAAYLVNGEDPVGFSRTEMSDMREFAVGSFAVRALHTPGHTYTHLSYELMQQGSRSAGVFTGGSLLFGSTGRPDLLGPEHATTLARMQHGSARRLAELLEDHVSIYPTHGFGSFCAATPTSGSESTIGMEKGRNPALLNDLDVFVRETLQGLDVFPSYYRHMGPANTAGPAPVDLSPLRNLSGEEIRLALASSGWVVDLRPRSEWCEGHLYGSSSFGIDGSIATYLGWTYPYEKPLLLLGATAEQVATAQRELVRIGIDRPSGAYVGDLRSFAPLKTTAQRRFADAPDAIALGGVQVLDVRRSSERTQSHIEGSVHIPLHELSTRVEELSPEIEWWVHCAGGYRAAAAIGTIERAGRRTVLINEPYSAASAVAGLRFVTGSVDHTPAAPSDLE
jgi:glyoxylase-like metal-dependent hydrolase (beta-lactamase superfamily II)/rhodanese-related sulfurtransferase